MNDFAASALRSASLILGVTLESMLAASCAGSSSSIQPLSANNATTASSIAFSGLDSISGTGSTAAQLSWTSATGAVSYLIYSFDASGNLLNLATAPGAATSASVSGLSVATPYKFRVRLVDGKGLSDANTHDLAYTTPSITLPSAISGLTLWLHATAGVTKNGANAVSAWADQSGLSPANDTIQSGGGQPTWVDASLNSQPVLRFAGSQFLVRPSSNASMNLTNGTLFVVFRTSGAGTSYRGLFSKQSAYGLYLMDNKLTVYDWSTSATTTVGGTLNDGAAHLVEFVFQDGVASGSSLYIDTAQAGASFTYHVSNNAASNGVVAAGADSGTLQQYTGDLAEIVLYDSALSSTDRSTVETYLKSQWGL